jgi:hypothetical protein
MTFADGGFSWTTAAGDDSTRPETIEAGEWRLRAEVPDAAFSLAVEADDATARAEHEAFADQLLPSEVPGHLRDQVLTQLQAARQLVASSGIGYLGVLTGEVDGQARMLLLGVAAAPLEPPEGIDTASLLAAMLRHSYPEASALVEEFETDHGQAVGVRRCDELTLPFPGPDGQPARIDTGISQAMVIFPEAKLLGVVTGFCFDPDDIDLTTVFTAAIAHRLTVTRGAAENALRQQARFAPGGLPGDRLK